MKKIIAAVIIAVASITNAVAADVSPEEIDRVINATRLAAAEAEKQAKVAIAEAQKAAKIAAAEAERAAKVAAAAEAEKQAKIAVAEAERQAKVAAAASAAKEGSFVRAIRGSAERAAEWMNGIRKTAGCTIAGEGSCKE